MAPSDLDARTRGFEADEEASKKASKQRECSQTGVHDAQAWGRDTATGVQSSIQ